MLSINKNIETTTRNDDHDSIVPCMNKSTRIYQHIKQDISSSNIVVGYHDDDLLSLMSKENAVIHECETLHCNSSPSLPMESTTLTNNNEINQFISLSPNMSTPSSFTSGGYLEPIPESDHEDDHRLSSSLNKISLGDSIHDDDDDQVTTSIPTSSRSRSHSYSLDIQLPVVSLLPNDSSVLTSLPDPRPLHVTHLQQGPAHDLFIAMNNVLDPHSQALSKFHHLLRTERSEIPDAQWVRLIASLFSDAPWLVEPFLVVVGWCGSFDPLSTTTSRNSSPNFLPCGSPMRGSVSHSPPGTSPGWFASPTTFISLATPAIALDGDIMNPHSSSTSSSPMDPLCHTDGFADFQLPKILCSPVPSPTPNPTLDPSSNVSTHHRLHTPDNNNSSLTHHLSPNMHLPRSPSPLHQFTNNKQWIPPELAYPFDHDSSKLHEEQDNDIIIKPDDLDWEDIDNDMDNNNDNRIQRATSHKTNSSLTPAKLISAYAEMTLGSHHHHHPCHYQVGFHRHLDKSNPNHDN